MTVNCPRCRIVQAEWNETCVNCGRPLTPAQAAPDASVDLAPRADTSAESLWADPEYADGVDPDQARQSPWWLPAVVAVSLLLALTVLGFFVVQNGSARHTALAANPAADASDPPVPPPIIDNTHAPTFPAAPVMSAPPLTPAPHPVKIAVKKPQKAPVKAAPFAVLLTSSSHGHHIRVGEDVTLTALAHGRCATLTLSYRHGLGQKTMHSFTEGSLLSTTWTPTVPGRYGFTATARNGQWQTAASRPVEITVDKPAPQRPAWDEPTPRRVARDEQARPLPTEVIMPLPPMPVRLPPLPRHPRVLALPPVPVRVAALPRPVRLPPFARPVRAARPRAVTEEMAAPEKVLPEKTVPDTTASQDEATAPRRAPATLYHVAAFQCPSSRRAVVLAKAFMRRGRPATTKRMIGYNGKTVYAVVTGAYRSPEEASTAVLALKRGGYPAYSY